LQPPVDRIIYWRPTRATSIPTTTLYPGHTIGTLSENTNLRINARLSVVADLIGDRVGTLVDVGSENAHLLSWLLANKRISFGIAVENKRRPFEISQNALQNVNAEVRFGDGLEVLKPGETDCLSICGLGANSILNILSTYPDRVPDRIVIQLGDQPELIRSWAIKNGFKLLDERMVQGFRFYTALSFCRMKSCGPVDKKRIFDLAYLGIDRDISLAFGPLLIKRKDLHLRKMLEAEKAHLQRIRHLDSKGQLRLALLEQAIRLM